MNGIAALAAKEAAVAGLGASLLPGVASSAVDGFAVGTLLSGMCFLLVIGPRRQLRRTRIARRSEVWAPSDTRPAHADYAAAPVSANPYANPYADESAETLLPARPAKADEPTAEPASVGSPDYRSRHRLPGSEGDRRQEQRRSPGRHAAPSARFSSRMASRLPFRALAVRD
jgi:hypothetical protein